jgi:ATP-dependent DNA helicase RecG
MATRRPQKATSSELASKQLGFDFAFPDIRPTRLWSENELYDGMSEKVVVETLEDHRVERKSARYNSRELGEYFSMWANTPPFGGIILLGVENDGKITGCRHVELTHINELQRTGDIFCSEARYSAKL